MPTRLPARLQRGLDPIYLVYGDETLLVEEATDQIRAAARAAGFVDRQVFHVDPGFSWSGLLAASSEQSLFAERKLLDLRLHSGRPGEEGARVLRRLCAEAHADTLLLVTAPRLDAGSRRSKWFQALEKAGTVVACWPIADRQLPGWLEQRLQRAGLDVEPDALALLVDRVQGNLLAAAQEVERLTLYATEGRVTVDTVAASVGDSSRFDVFTLVDRALAGHSGPALRSLRGLQAEGTEAPVVLWALTRELRLLYRAALAGEQGQNIDRMLASARVLGRRQPLIKGALRRLSGRQLGTLLRRAAQVDRAIKGAAGEDPWRRMEDLVLALSGRPRGVQPPKPR